jgi:Mg2+-importing ATPase
VAKDSADLIILTKRLDVIIEGIFEGRKVFINTMKFIFSTMSSSFGNVLTITIASAFLKFLPLLPAQILLLDSLSDFQHLAISTDSVDKELLQKPKEWNMRIFFKYSVYWGLISTFFDFSHMAIILALSSSPEVFRTTWIIESITTEIVATMSLRTARLAWKSKPSLLLAAFSVIPIATVLILAFTPIGQELFGLVPISGLMIGVVVIIVAIYFVGLELVKRFYYREFWNVGKLAKHSKNK